VVEPKKAQPSTPKKPVMSQVSERKTGRGEVTPVRKGKDATPLRNVSVTPVRRSGRDATPQRSSKSPAPTPKRATTPVPAKKEAPKVEAPKKEVAK
jgi:hypothetical protein